MEVFRNELTCLPGYIPACQETGTYVPLGYRTVDQGNVKTSREIVWGVRRMPAKGPKPHCSLDIQILKHESITGKLQQVDGSIDEMGVFEVGINGWQLPAYSGSLNGDIMDLRMSDSQFSTAVSCATRGVQSEVNLCNYRRLGIASSDDRGDK